MGMITIEIDEDLMETLRSMGQDGESFNDIIRNLVVDARYIEFMDECNDIVENEENWTNVNGL